MPRDHFVPQVYLRNFYPEDKESMWGIHKRNLKTFPCQSKDICRIIDGNTNNFLSDERGIEDFLKNIEPKYNSEISSLRGNKIDPMTIYVISGMVTYIASCSPGAQRIQSHPLAEIVDASARMLDKAGRLPPAPEVLGAKTLTELLDKGSIKCVIDPKYPQALGGVLLNEITLTFGNCRWDILHNPIKDSPFFTSDHPVAIEEMGPHLPRNRIIPLARDLCIRIWPPPGRLDRLKDETFPKFASRHQTLNRQQVSYINSLVVRCAEQTVFFSKQRTWIPNFVSKNRNFRIENRIVKAENGGGYALMTEQCIVPFNYELSP